MGHLAKLTLMNVQQIHVKMEEHVLMELTHLLVGALLASMDHPVKLILTIAHLILVRMEAHVLIDLTLLFVSV